jgi:hypothetical protein
VSFHILHFRLNVLLTLFVIPSLHSLFPVSPIQCTISSALLLLHHHRSSFPTPAVPPLLLLSMFSIAARYKSEPAEPLPLNEGDMWNAGDDYLEGAKQILSEFFFFGLFLPFCFPMLLCVLYLTRQALCTSRWPAAFICSLVRLADHAA